MIASAAQTAGYPALFFLVMAESGGIPLPGETALITAAVLASQGQLQIEFVIALAALAAIIGDNVGYLISRKVGRTLLERPGPFERRRRRVLEIGEPFFERHGPKAVFLGRWILGLRTWAVLARRGQQDAVEVVRRVERGGRNQLGNDDRSGRLPSSATRRRTRSPPSAYSACWSSCSRRPARCSCAAFTLVGGRSCLPRGSSGPMHRCRAAPMSTSPDVGNIVVHGPTTTTCRTGTIGHERHPHGRGGWLHAGAGVNPQAEEGRR